MFSRHFSTNAASVLKKGIKKRIGMKKKKELDNKIKKPYLKKSEKIRLEKEIESIEKIKQTKPKKQTKPRKYTKPIYHSIITREINGYNKKTQKSIIQIGCGIYYGLNPDKITGHTGLDTRKISHFMGQGGIDKTILLNLNKDNKDLTKFLDNIKEDIQDKDYNEKVYKRILGIAELMYSGMNSKDISLMTGLVPSTINQHAKELNLRFEDFKKYKLKN